MIGGQSNDHDTKRYGMGTSIHARGSKSGIRWVSRLQESDILIPSMEITLTSICSS
jgi:hypothetical protein